MQIQVDMDMDTDLEIYTIFQTYKNQHKALADNQQKPKQWLSCFGSRAVLRGN